MTGNNNNNGSGSDARRVAIITGAAQGIGRAIALRLARDGFDLGLADLERSQTQLKGVVDEAVTEGQGKIKAIAVPCDVSQKKDVDGLVDRTVAELGRLDVMIANAGICPVGPFLEIDVDTFDNLMAVNVRGVLLCYQAGARQFLKQGGGGKLIAASSIAGVEGYAGFSAYSSSKFAVRSLTQSVAKELGPHGITCNVYCPAPVDTQMWIDADIALSKMLGGPQGTVTKSRLAVAPMKRLVAPADVANLVSFMAGPDSNFVSGESILVAGAEAVH